MKGKNVVESKLNMSLKTGVLNISEQDLKRNSSVWNKLANEEYAAKLTSINISKNNLKEVPIQILSLRRLKILNMSDCNISIIPGMEYYDQLVNLNISHNDIPSDIKDIALPSSLTHCDASYNRFDNFPTFLINLTTIVELNLSNNHIILLDGIETLTSLTHLILDDNSIFDIPIEIGNLQKLKLLSLKRNKISRDAKTREGYSLPEQLFSETALDNLNLEGNRDLKKSDILEMPGVSIFLERRQKTKEKALHGGALTEYSLFGLD
jgi:Leucine-rich repeat (LRR) protein